MSAYKNATKNPINHYNHYTLIIPTEKSSILGIKVMDNFMRVLKQIKVLEG